jgi:hypothetical protein
MDTPIVFPDGRLVIRDRLRTISVGNSDPAIAGVTVSTRDFPSNDSAPPPVPYLQVKSDGSARDSALNGRATIRILAYGADDGLTTRLALLAEALILADHDDEGLRGCSPQQSTFPTYDPDLGRPMAYFTFTARLRPSNL